ncbi:MAG: cytochrome c biogenesis protein ResB [Chloroflexota bacterium]
MGIDTPESSGGRTSWQLFRRYPWDVLWRFFASPGTTRVWLACLIVATIMGSFFPQAPPEADGDPMAYHRWLATVIPRYGSWGDVLSRLGLFNLRSALWYRGVWALAALNLLIVGVEQIDLRWRAWRALPSPDTLSPLLHDVSEAELRSTRSPVQVAEAARILLRGRGYHLNDDLSSEGTGCLSAQRHGLAWMAPVVLHVGLLMLLLGIVVNQSWAWREGPFFLAAGETHRLAHDSGQVVRLDETWPENGLVASPGHFHSVLTLQGSKEESRTITLRRNAPVFYDGMLIYQVASGPLVRVSASDAAGEPILLESLGTSESVQREILILLREEQNESWIGAPSQGIALHISRYDPAQAPARRDSSLRFRAYRGNESEPIVDQSMVGSRSLEVSGATCHLVVESYAAILVVRSPGLVLLALGAFLALAGFCLIRVLFPRYVWLDIGEGRKKGSRVRMTVGGKKMSGWVESLLDDARRMLEAPEDRA